MIGNFIFDPFKYLFHDKSITPDVLFFSLLLIFLPVALITGPAIPDIFLTLIAIFFLVKSILKKKWHYYQNSIAYGFLLFSLYIVVRSVFSESLVESLTTGGSLFYFRYIFFALGVWYLLDNNHHLSKCLLIISIICIVFVSIDAIYQYFFDFNFFGNKKHNDYRLTGVFGDEPIVGRYVAYLSTFIFVVMYQNFSNQKKILKFFVPLLILCQVVVFLSGERAPLFYLILFSILIVTFISNYRTYKIITIFFSLIVIMCISSINPNAKIRIADLTIKQVNQTKLPFLPYSDHHEEHYISALKMFENKPIFGVGANLFRYQCKNPQYKYKIRSCSTHPHNFYIQTLAELGIVGFIFILTFFLYLSFFLIKNLSSFLKPKTNERIPLICLPYIIILFTYWWPLIPHMNFYNNWNNVLVMLPLGFFMKCLYSNFDNGNFN